jgi:hypothetical protein
MTGSQQVRRLSFRVSLAWWEWVSAILSVAYIAAVAGLADATDFKLLLFPELGALAYDVLRRPHGLWARSPILLIVTPFLAGLAGTAIAQVLPYGIFSVSLALVAALLILRYLQSPIAPAISAGILPLVLGVTSWWYPPALLVGTVGLALLSSLMKRVAPQPPPKQVAQDRLDDELEDLPRNRGWILFFAGFLGVALVLAVATGSRMLLYPPLIVMAFEMFAHAEVCPWAKRPLLLPLGCAAISISALTSLSLLGPTPLGAALSLTLAIAIIRLCDLHVPPLVAVGLLPFVINAPDYTFAVATTVGTALLVGNFLLWSRR